MDTDSVIIEYSMNGGATWFHGRTVAASVATDPDALAQQRRVVRELAYADHGNVENVITRVLDAADPQATINRPPFTIER